MLPDAFDVIGPWSEVKLDILREYASPYSRIVTAHGFHHLYIDAYAAGGSHISRTTGEIVLGSPLIALATEPPFREYHFIDAFEPSDRTHYFPVCGAEREILSDHNQSAQISTAGISAGGACGPHYFPANYHLDLAEV